MLTLGHRLHSLLITRGPGVLILALVTALYVSGGFESAELSVTDSRFKVLQGLAPRAVDGEIVLVGIDVESLRAAGRWPWPRSYHAALVDRLTAAGAGRIAFDLVFSSEQDPRQDRAFAQAIERASGRVVLAALRELRMGPDGTLDLVHTEPLEAFGRTAELASINVHPETDGLVRRMATAYPWPGKTLPTLAAELAGEEDHGIAEYWIDFGVDPATIPRLSYIDVARGDFDPARVRGRTVIVGATALELNDRLQVPVFGALDGAVLQILAAETLKRGPLLRIAPAVVVAGTLLLVLLLARRFDEWGWRRGLVWIVATAAALYVLSLVLQHGAQVLLDIVPAVAAVLSAYAWALFQRIDRQSLSLLLQGAEIRRKDVLMRHVVESTFDGIVSMDGKGRVRLLNPAARKIFGYSNAEMAGRHVSRLLFEGEHAEADHRRINALLSRRGPVELTGRHKSGDAFPMDIAVSRVTVEGEVLMTAVVRDITERRRQNDALRHQALHDALTDLPNRTLLYDRIEQAIRDLGRNDGRLALLLFDLDRFKEVNDTLGHPVGDILLREVADRLRQGIRETDTVARLGGDEFAILLPRIDDLSTAEWVAEKVRRNLLRPFGLQGLTLEIGASAGIALYPDHGSSAAELVQKADVAMYAAKRALAGHAVYDAEKDHHSVRHLTLSGELREAIEGGGLELRFQPKVDLSKNRVVGVEALTRWNHPAHGFISPEEFIRVAEKTGLIGPLTDWVLETAIAQWSAWRDDGVDIGIAVNLSAQQLHDQTLPDAVAAKLAARRMPAEALTLEVTEGAIMVDPVCAMRTIQSLNGFGVRLSIDDFGTGYSSLSYLKDLSAAELKIDRGFVRDVCRNEGNRKIVRSTINLAHNLGLKVVGEGIEDDETLRLLTDLSCDVGQGYFFSRPLSAGNFAVWMAETPWRGSLAQRVMPA